MLAFVRTSLGPGAAVARTNPIDDQDRDCYSYTFVYCVFEKDRYKEEAMFAAVSEHQALPGPGAVRNHCIIGVEGRQVCPFRFPC